MATSVVATPAQVGNSRIGRRFETPNLGKDAFGAERALSATRIGELTSY